MLKSGRQSPYFIDLGVLTQGSAISELGRYYASKINESFGTDFDVVFGPAYKAIPLAISATMALNSMGMDKRWLFDRKEMKMHGADASAVFVGSQNLDHGQRVVIVDDVMTTGGTKLEAIKKLEDSLKAEVKGIVVAVDRMEMGRRASAVAEFTDDTGIPVHSIDNIGSIFSHLKGRAVDNKVYVTDKIFGRYEEYMGKYGVKKIPGT
ncbi:orotate phosphoribosyltransferase [Candidatus Micrarchaeota archaeon]|nr:orotate phosphoribosyltransferase [Candidatus Micrarchaeota archaeon]